jgi:polyisoprenoid-binding protein YceI
MAIFRIVPDRSTLEIEARSSLHPINGEATGLEGAIEAEIVDGRLDLSIPPMLRLEVPVSRLSSGNALYDGEMQRRIDSRRYPRIVAEAKDVRALGQDSRYSVRGDVSLHGVTKAVEGELNVSLPDERTLVVEGAHSFDIRDFNISAPKIMMLKVHPDVNVRLRLVAERVEETNQ